MSTSQQIDAAPHGAAPASCTICGAIASSPVLEGTDEHSGERFEARRCSCGGVYTSPRPASLDRYYAQDEYYAYRPARLRPLERLRLSLIMRVPYGPILRSGPGTMLDVGCGAGRLAGAFRRRGWTVHGIEPSPTGAEAARRTGMHVHVGTLDDELPWSDGGFDAVVFNHSLEHVADPVATLARARELLRPGGLVGVSVPNFDCWQRRAFGARWGQLDVPRHVTHFNRASLGDTAQRAGLDVVKLGSSSMMAGLVMSVRNVTGGHPGNGRPGVALGLAAYPLLVGGRLLGQGDVLNLVARA